MGDSRRFDLFAKVVERNIPKDYSIADVASGKGYLQAALRQRGFEKITSWDKRKRNAKNRRGYYYGYFNWQTDKEYDAVVAMHPDEATDHAILYAGKNRVPAIVCPCCTKPDATVYWGEHSYGAWLKYLRKLALENKLEVTETVLPMVGRNVVFILKPR